MDNLQIILVILIIFYMFKCKKEYFSMSNKPMEHDWSLLHMNPFDNIDYQTPTYTPK